MSAYGHVHHEDFVLSCDLKAAQRYLNDNYPIQAGKTPADDVTQKGNELLQYISNLKVQMENELTRLRLTPTPDTAHAKPVLVNPEDVHIHVCSCGQRGTTRFMTGKEWCERFKEELDELDYDAKDSMSRGMYRNASVTLAAKRTAAIDD